MFVNRELLTRTWQTISLPQCAQLQKINLQMMEKCQVLTVIKRDRILVNTNKLMLQMFTFSKSSPNCNSCWIFWCHLPICRVLQHLAYVPLAKLQMTLGAMFHNLLKTDTSCTENYQFLFKSRDLNPIYTTHVYQFFNFIFKFLHCKFVILYKYIFIPSRLHQNSYAQL